MAYLCRPQRHTFYPSVLPVLVIFFLQHTSPAVLPNLHEIYRQHRNHLPSEAIETVRSSFRSFHA